jgi:hypothetical protein
MALTATQAAEEFADVIPVFRRAWEMAWADNMNRFNEPGWDNSCRSHVIQMQAVIHTRELFDSSPDVAYHKINNRHVFTVRDNGLFKLKQFDENHCSSNFSTKAAREFESQIRLDGFEEYQRFTIGFIPKPDWTGYVGIYLAYPKALRKRPNWVLDITSGTAVDIESLQNEFDEPISQPERRFKPKKQSDRRTGRTGI